MEEALLTAASVLQGTAVNGAAIALGGLLGVVLGGSIPERVRTVVLQGISLTVLLIGLQMALGAQQIMIVAFSLILGGVTGELLDLDAWLQRAGVWLEARVSGSGSGVAKAFVFATLLYGVGAMAVTGALESGLQGSHQVLYAKAVLDGVTAVAFAATMGIGISLSALPVVLYQGGMALAAGSLRPYLGPAVIAEMSAVGGLLILCIGLGMLGLLKDLKVANFLPAIAYAAGLTLLL